MSAVVDREQPGECIQADAVIQLAIPTSTDPNLFARTVAAADLRAPVADQFSLEVQRQLGTNLAVRVGYVGTFGHDLFQTLDGNPRLPFSTERVDPSQGAIRLRANTAQSWYHSVQTQLDKRLSGGVSASVHYTWSRFEDTASDMFNASVSEVAVAQDSFNLDVEKARSTYDRPHRLTGNFVWELPFRRHEEWSARFPGVGRSAPSSRSRAVRRSPSSTAPIRRCAGGDRRARGKCDSPQPEHQPRFVADDG